MVALYPPLSPAELLKVYLRSSVNPLVIAPANVVVGALSHDQQQTGGVSVMNAGLPELESNLPLVWVRAQVRVLASRHEKQDEISRHLWELCSQKNRLVVADGYGRKWLIHVLNVVAGPSDHKDSEVTEEGLLFAHMMVGTEPIGS